MKFKNFLLDKLYVILSFLITSFVLLLLFLAFKVHFSLMIASFLLLVGFLIFIIVVEYFRKKTFYNQLLMNINRLDKAYLVLETIEKPNFYEGELWYQALYEINKSMCELVGVLENQMDDFKNFIEMWIHEVKLPISSLELMAHNHKDKFDKNSLEQIKRLENYVEQVLYYVRAENAEQDYLIKENKLDKIIHHLALRNKDDLLENQIDFIVENVNCSVYTDSKWLEFILNQIINNSMKYRKEGVDSYIKIKIQEEKDKIILMVEDNGIGIPPSDLPKVFDKSFTGYNGRLKAKSTGMGLFIAKNLCKKLGHKIEIESIQNEYTRVYIVFYKNDYYQVLK